MESANASQGIAPPRELTFGEKAVGVSFNPSKFPVVDEIKALYAIIIDICDTERKATQDGGKIRHYSTAITDAETAQMRAVKAATWGL